jgi:glycosyltransferase involved in cell wall biosynthesis
MKIAIVAPTAIPSRRANTIQIMKMSQALANSGHTVRLAAPGGAEKSGSLTWENLAHHYGLQPEVGSDPTRFDIEWLPARNNMRRYDYGWHSVRWARRWGADILFTRLPQAATIGSQLGMPTILEIHDLPAAKSGSWLFRLFLQGSGARRLVAITRALAEDLQRRFKFEPAAESPDAFTVIAPDGVDLNRYSNLPDPAKARNDLKLGLPDRFTAGYTGHLYSGRGVETILTLAKRLPEINFLLAGGEPAEVARLSHQVKLQGLENVFLTGFVPNADLPLYQAACEALLMPYQAHVSASSGGDIARYLSPMKVFEYMACKRVIVSSNLPVLLEVLNPENSILLEPDDLESWSDTLHNLAEYPEKYHELALQARQDAGQYSWEKRAQRIITGIELSPTSKNQ